MQHFPPMIKAVLAGFVASIAMLALLYLLPVVGAPQLNVFGELSTLSPRSAWWAAPLEYLVLGTFVFPLLYAKLIYKDLSGPPWRKGLVWGLVLWLIRGIIVMPVMGQGLFSLRSADPVASIIETLAGHAIYGVLLGAIAGDMAVSRVRIIKPHHYSIRR